MEQKVATTEKKTIKRGLSTARGTVRLKFTHSDAVGTNGLFLAHLDSVQVTDIKIGEDKTGMPSFNGLTIPRLSFTFASNDDDVNKRRYITLSFTLTKLPSNHLLLHQIKVQVNHLQNHHQ